MFQLNLELGNKSTEKVGKYVGIGNPKISEISWDLDWEMIENQKLGLGLDLEILWKM